MVEEYAPMHPFLRVGLNQSLRWQDLDPAETYEFELINFWKAEERKTYSKIGEKGNRKDTYYIDFAAKVLPNCILVKKEISEANTLMKIGFPSKTFQNAVEVFPIRDRKPILNKYKEVINVYLRFRKNTSNHMKILEMRVLSPDEKEIQKANDYVYNLKEE